MADQGLMLCQRPDTGTPGIEPDMFVVNSRPSNVHNKSPSEVTYGAPTESKPSKMSFLMAKSASAGASPSKSMRDCMFQFPMPNPRTWTILWEPAMTAAPSPKHASGGGCRQGSQQPLMDELSSGLGTSPGDDARRGSGGEIRRNGSLQSSPTRRRRQKIFLNGKCIDNMPLKRWKAHRDLPADGAVGVAAGAGAATIYTFVTDKLMPPNDASPAAAERGLPSVSLGRQGEEPMAVDGLQKVPQLSTPEAPGRELTFHQLAFNSKTLKSYDRAVFTVSGSKARAGVGADSGPKRRTPRSTRWSTPIAIDETLPPVPRRRQMGCKLVEAAEILLELSYPE